MDVVVVGSCNTDLLSTVPRLPGVGETIHGKTFTVGFGGKGANQCVISARLGAQTAMVAKVGDDIFGHNYMENLKKNGINTEYVGVTDKAATGVASISVTDKGENSIVIVSGANLLLSEQDISAAESMIKQSKVLVCQLETRAEVSLAALKLAKQHKVFTILNPAPAIENLSPEFYSNSDIFCPNESEAELLTGCKVQSVADAGVAISKLQQQGCRTVIITLGEKGAVFASQDDPAPVHVLCNHIKPLDTTGAGDAFVGALAFYLATMPSLGLRESIQRACAIATVSVQSAGTQTSFPYRKDLPQALFS